MASATNVTVCPQLPFAGPMMLATPFLLLSVKYRILAERGLSGP
jgi:hypothetical protein